MFLNEGAKLHNGRYLILRELGSGGMGTAYLARDTALEREVVVKASRNDLDPEQLRFEAKLPAKLRHPNLPVIFDYIQGQAGQAFIVMEYIRGETLDDVVKTHGRCEVEQVLTWIPKLLSALQHLHTQNPPLIHRDVKPANICLTPNDDLFLLDFGIARHLDGSDTRVEARARTDGYAPIEQYAGDSRLKGRPSAEQYVVALRQAGYATAPYTDIYSFGATLYFLLTAKNPTNAVLRVLGEPLEVISDLNESVPDLLAEAITKALALHPRDRFQSAVEMQQFLAPILSTPAPVQLPPRFHRPTPFMSDDLPSGFVPRPAEFEAIVSAVLADAGGVITLQGAGGFGKTTLAQAICHDQRVWTAFPDGILWVTLGETADITGGLTKLYAILTGQRPVFVDQEDGANHLVLALKDMQCLLVIDDVWNPAHLRPFLRGGPGCVRLITTRLRDMLPADSAQITIDTMQQAEAVSLLAAGLPDIEATALEQLAARLGEWALLVKLANGALQHRVNKQGQLAAEALAYVNRVLDKRGLTALDRRNPVSREQAVTETLQVSFGLLTADEYARFSELAIFPDDVDIPLSTVETLWLASGGLDELDTEELLDQLSRLSLLQRFSLNSRFVRLHDIIRHFLREQHKQRLPDIHRLFLDAHRPRRPSTLLPEPSQAAIQTDGAFSWADLAPDEPYLWRHLAHHLIEAGAEKEFAATVKDMRYLVLKCYLSDVVMAEFDLQRAEKLMPGDTVLNRLRQTFIQNSHLLARCDTLNDLIFSLGGRLHQVPALQSIAASFLSMLTPPHLTTWLPLPDAPSPALIRTLPCPTPPEYCEFSPDGRLILAVHSDYGMEGQVTVWNWSAGRMLYAVSGERGQQGQMFSPDGRLMACVGEKTTIKILEAGTGQEWCTFSGHSSRIHDYTFSPDSRLIVSASDDQTLKIWSIKTKQVLHTLTGHTGAVNCCVFSPDGRWIASGGSDTIINLWEATIGKVLISLKGHTCAVRRCEFSPDGQQLESYADNTWEILISFAQEPVEKVSERKAWDLKNGRELLVSASLFASTHELVGLVEKSYPDQSVSAVFDSARKQIAVILNDNTIRLWNTATATEKMALAGHTGRVDKCAFSFDGDHLASGSVDHTLKIWRTKLNRDSDTEFVFRKFSGCRVCALSPTGQLLAFSTDNRRRTWDDENEMLLSTQDYELILLNVDSNQIIKAFRFSSAVSSCSFHPNGRYLLVILKEDGPRLFDAYTGVEVPSFLPWPDSQGADSAFWELTSGFFSPDGAAVAIAGSHFVRLFDVETGVQIRSLAQDTGLIIDGAFSPDGDFLVTMSEEGHLTVWDVGTGHKVRTLADQAATRVDVWDTDPLSVELESRRLNAFSVSLNQQFVASASEDVTIKLWDFHSGEALDTLMGHKLSESQYATNGVTSCAFSPDGNYLLSTSHDASLKIWDIGGIREGKSGHCVATFPVNGALYDCAWHPDGERIIAVGEGGVYFLRFIT